MSDRHTPRMRGIQYAAAYRVKHQRLWNTGSPAFAGDNNEVSDCAPQSSSNSSSSLTFALWRCETDLRPPSEPVTVGSRDEA